MKTKINVPITIKLVSPADQGMEGTLVMLGEKVHPYWVVTSLETWSAEVIRVDSSTETITLWRELSVNSERS